MALAVRAMIQALFAWSLFYLFYSAKNPVDMKSGNKQ